jgi:rhodanese-related sulfurtransferase
VTVVEFGDFECPMCGHEEEVMRQIRAKYADQIRFVFRQFPLTRIHPFAERMAEASECAADQGKFWEAVDKIYSRQTDLTDEGLKRDAAEIGLDLTQFNQCLASGTESGRVRRDHEDGQALGVVATPTFFIGRKALPDAPGFDEFSRLIDRELAAEGVGLSAAPPRIPLPPASQAAGAEHPPKIPFPSQKPAPAPAKSDSAPSPFSLLSSPGGGLASFGSGSVTCSEAEAAMKQPTLINSDQLRNLLHEKTPSLFVDVRPAKDYAAGHIEGAINIPVDDMNQRWNTLPKDHVIIFYESGQTSGDICAVGRAAGRILLAHDYPFDQVKVYQDGLAGWKKSGLSAP